jgi:hypothetical protein
VVKLSQNGVFFSLIVFYNFNTLESENLIQHFHTFLTVFLIQIKPNFGLVVARIGEKSLKFEVFLMVFGYFFEIILNENKAFEQHCLTIF